MSSCSFGFPNRTAFEHCLELKSFAMSCNKLYDILSAAKNFLMFYARLQHVLVEAPNDHFCYAAQIILILYHILTLRAFWSLKKALNKYQSLRFFSVIPEPNLNPELNFIVHSQELVISLDITVLVFYSETTYQRQRFGIKLQNTLQRFSFCILSKKAVIIKKTNSATSKILIEMSYLKNVKFLIKKAMNFGKKLIC